MPLEVRNNDIATMFNQLADLLEIEGANPFRVRAYRNAARQITGLPHELSDMVTEGEDLSALPAIGEDLAAKIEEIVTTGRFPMLEEVSERVPPGLAEIVSLPGLGPKRTKLLHDELGVTSIKELASSIRSGAAEQLPGLGKKTVAKVLRAIEKQQTAEHRFKLFDAERLAEPLFDFIKGMPGVENAVISGSYRRRKETVGDIDILATSRAGKGSAIISAFTEYLSCEHVVSKGTTRSTIVLRGGLQVDLRVVEPESFGAALHYFTGSKAHNIAIRRRGVKQGLKVNEYGIFDGEKQIAGRTEAEIYDLFGMDYIEPELRENNGEIEAAEEHRLPELVSLDDIRGDLHAHTLASDGTQSITEMAEAAEARGYAYLAITDHSQRVTVANGLDEKRLNQQIDEIDRLQEKFSKIKILKSCEVDILKDGRLDIENKTLERLDFVYGAVHYNFTMTRDEQTERIIRAMDNPHFTILAHPTGRIINRRPPYDVDMERVINAAAERGCMIEINAHPDRLDMNDVHARMAKEMGVKIAISTDAHSADGLDMMRFGIGQARRAWLTKQDVANTRSLSTLRKLFAKR